MHDNVYSNSKAAWHVDSIKALRNKRAPFFKHVQLILSDLCNQNCSFCSYRAEGGLSTELFRGPKGEINPNRKIPTAKAFEIILDSRYLGAKAMQFTGGGEPSVHPDWVNIIKYAQLNQLQVGLVTNGTKLNLCPNNLDWLRVSLDAGTAETYNRIRQSDRFDDVLGKVTSFVKNREPQCVVGVGYVITPDNFEEVRKGVEVVRKTGADYIRLSAMFSENGGEVFSETQRKFINSEIARAKLENHNFKIVDLFSDRMHDLDQGAPDYDFCGVQHFTTYIGGDQCVYRCCTTAYSKRGKVGDLTNQTLAEWWEHEGPAKMLNFNARSCKFCMFNNKNRAIEELVYGEPKHVNFV